MTDQTAKTGLVQRLNRIERIIESALMYPIKKLLGSAYGRLDIAYGDVGALITLFYTPVAVLLLWVYTLIVSVPFPVLYRIEYQASWALAIAAAFETIEGFLDRNGWHRFARLLIALACAIGAFWIWYKTIHVYSFV